ncbi:MAG TPA: YggS family pyridoxal phosphate-dependent enzyme [Thermoanaerobaculales bacterium]|nr:YggS family pyridoxal phosphate-dependent enzyme [Thermoanaerobaculales bacterium]HPA80834.1 YggS family pyridoxal phosphate-dependent enzyme [Thermoanaerobaculales bacterium]HQL29873.1 YggS family pyridoxal phosphate-dependent enzyme [Thermoanaerobaculales bacterium]HQN96708.1 YggS family pyridoxal phosphate-dependent enzyme [Thermoanaerobaculales bacterium]HQP44581.1 YggS family pyridoxal phosphate-dependent enzyme [Thermoanaerobaculales bacterium]
MAGGVAERLEEVRRRIAAAAERTGRDPAEVTLIVVGKTFPAEVVAQAVRAGATDLGENRVQEAAAKRPAVPPATWHLIGPLQRNKAAAALATFDVIHTVDRAEIADRLQLLLERDWPGRRQRVLMEVNVGREPQKAGALPEGARDLAAAILGHDRLELLGLMAIPPFGDDPEASRPHFRALRELRDRLSDGLGRTLPQLSMGMSLDFEVAVAEGATMVRVGTAIFGERGGAPTRPGSGI